MPCRELKLVALEDEDRLHLVVYLEGLEGADAFKITHPKLEEIKNMLGIHPAKDEVVCSLFLVRGE